jgi:hypothetical protein
MQLLDCYLAQQAYEERLRKAEQNLNLRLALREPAGLTPIVEANEFVNQIKGWLRGRPRREVAGARALSSQART